MGRKMRTTKIFNIPKIAVYLAILVAGGAIYGIEAEQQSLPFRSRSSDGGVSSGPANYSVFPLVPSAPLVGIVDNSIDEKSYYIGGGDVLHIYIVDLPTMNYTGVVNQNCDIIISNLGIIHIGKVTLARAKEIVVEYMREKLRRPNEIRVVLENVKNVSLYVFGSVGNPGTYNFSGMSRLWDVLKATGADLSNNNFRAVRRTNKDTVTFFDMHKYLYKEDFSQNPYIYPGDEFSVFPALNRVYITGAGLRAWMNGFVPILPNERAGDFLSLFFFSENADTEHILISRTENGREYTMTTINLEENADFSLRNNDVITIPVKKDLSELCMVTVSGEVARTGVYPIAKSGTKVQSVIALAGGFTTFADSQATIVLRRSKPAPSIVAPGNRSEAEGTIRPEMTSALTIMSTTRDFQVIRLKDFPETPLRSGDQIMVRRMEGMVYVSGSVKHPGGFPFVPDKKKEYYLRLAGGCNEFADKKNISILASYGDVFQKKSNRDNIADGDVIAVPVSKEYKLLTMVILPALSAILATVGIVVSVLAVRR
jgi:protein involved in polysaccharide export with SLBB domain